MKNQRTSGTQSDIFTHQNGWKIENTCDVSRQIDFGEKELHEEDPEKILREKFSRDNPKIFANIRSCIAKHGKKLLQKLPKITLEQCKTDLKDWLSIINSLSRFTDWFGGLFA